MKGLGRTCRPHMKPPPQPLAVVLFQCHETSSLVEQMRCTGGLNTVMVTHTRMETPFV